MQGPTGWPVGSAPWASAPRSWWACASGVRRNGGGAPGRTEGRGRLCPLDPDYPADRLAFMLEDAPHIGRPHRVRAASAGLLRRRPRWSALDRESESIATEVDGNLDGGAGLHNLAYVIYTSGSTGGPRGAMIHHLGPGELSGWCSRAYSIALGQGSTGPFVDLIRFDDHRLACPSGRRPAGRPAR